MKADSAAHLIEKRARARTLFEQATGHAVSSDWATMPEKHLDALIKCLQGMIDGDQKVIAAFLDVIARIR